MCITLTKPTSSFERTLLKESGQPSQTPKPSSPRAGRLPQRSGPADQPPPIQNLWFNFGFGFRLLG